MLGQDPQYGFFGFFQTWEEAKKHSTGWGPRQILEKVKTSLLKVKNRQAAYERDSITFNKTQYSWPLLVGLLRAALENDGELRVLDFGGSLGTTYFQNRSFLDSLKKMSWNVVEQPHYAAAGKEQFENAELKFYSDFETCVRETAPNVLIASSVIQYLPEPLAMIQKFINSNIPYIIFDRTSFLSTADDKIAIQKVKPSIYEATFPIWFFNYEKFVAALTHNYQVIAEFEAFVAPQYIVEGIPGGDRGLILKKI